LAPSLVPFIDRLRSSRVVVRREPSRVVCCDPIAIPTLDRMPAPQLVPRPDGRVVAVDDVGDPAGAPVLYLHGTPDSRLSRHPDDALTARAGVRLLAVDRPGIGRSPSHPGRTLGSVADDLVAVLDAVGVDRAAVLAWSAGAPFAGALVARHPGRVAAVGLVAPLVPITAYADAAVSAAAGPGRQLFAEMAAEMAPEVVAAEVAPYLLPDPATPEAVAEQMAAEADPARADEVAGLAGGGAHLVAAAVEAVALGRDGLVQEVATQAAVPDVGLGPAPVPATVWSGAVDEVSPPAFGRWWAEVLGGDHVIVPAAGHALALPRWTEVLGRLTSNWVG
jgi:pimeloyl-ACP methyl ester carboxylesterase